MNTETGEILTNEEFMKKLDSLKDEKQKEEFKKKYKWMEVPPTAKQLKRKKVGRNELCPCGSSKKFKKCCLY